MTMDPYQELTLYQRSAVLMAAADLGLFRALADGPLSASAAASRIGAPTDSVSRLLSAMAGVGYLACTDGAYALNAFSKSFIEVGAGGMRRLSWKEHVFYGAWDRLGDAVRGNRALFENYRSRIANDYASVRNFLTALNDLAKTAAPGVLSTGAFDGASSLLDLGGGAGGYAAEIRKARPGCRVTLADLEEILPIAREYLASEGLGDGIELVTADFMKEGLGLGGRTFDRVFLSHILHDNDPAHAEGIVKRAAAAVAPGGRLVILDVLSTASGHGSPAEALFDLMMLVEVPNGRCHAVDDVRTWASRAGLPSVRVHKLYFGTLVEAFRE